MHAQQLAAWHEVFTIAGILPYNWCIAGSFLLEPKGPIVNYVTGGAVVSEESGKIKFLPLHNNPK